jgi:hydroxycarboxylate dehydrogenase B
MPTLSAAQLTRISSSIFVACGVPKDEADVVGEALAQANLAGHDSHGVIRIPEYVRSLENGDLTRKAEIQIIKDTDVVTLIAGNNGFGQVIGRWAMKIAIEKARKQGFTFMALNHSGHLGRIGDYPALAAKEGFVSLHFINTHGAGKIVAPFGGLERRMSANPIAAGIPVPGRTAIIIDMSTSAIAGGKVHVAYNKGEPIPEGCVLNQAGELTTDPTDFVEGGGALLHFGGHKGFALGLLCDILAGALCDASCSHPDIDRVANAMLTIILDPALFRDSEGFYREVIRYVDYLKGSALRPGFQEILYPGEPEARTESRRSKEGIYVDNRTWEEITTAASKYGITVSEYMQT